jgi:hypothetical protein
VAAVINFSASVRLKPVQEPGFECQIHSGCWEADMAGNLYTSSGNVPDITAVAKVI